MISAGARWCQNACIRVHVDNAASVFIWEKGYSTSCRLSTTIVKAISTVAASIGCRFEIVKITRCSLPQASMADAVSKGDFPRFHNLAWEEGIKPDKNSAVVPAAVLRWIHDPKEDDNLGSKILEELSESLNIL